MLCLLVRTHDGKNLPYLYNWRWPQKGEAAPGGQPTDQAPLDEGDAEQTKPIMTLLKRQRARDQAVPLDQGHTCD